MELTDFDKAGHPEYRGQTLYWVPMDTENLYRQNSKNQNTAELLLKNNWTENSITYRFNQHGFRSMDFNNDKNNIVFLGCSHTMGIGLEQTSVYASIVSSKLNLDLFNLGVGGASQDDCFRFAYSWLEKLQPKIVVYQEPDKSRVTYKFDKKWITYFVNDLRGNKNNIYHKIGVKHYLEWVREKINADIQREKNLISIKSLVANVKAKFILTSQHFPKVKDDCARDLLHFGRKAHQEKAELILKEIDSF